MRKLLIILIFISGIANAQISPFAFGGSGVWALDFDGSTEYLSCTPALRLTGEYSLVDNFSDGNYDGWTVSSGAYSVVDSTPLSGGTKALKCNTAGIISIPCNQAYGSWEFDWYKGADANRIDILFIKDNSSDISTGSGYCLTLRNNESGTLTRLTNGGGSDILQSTVPYFTNNTWYSCKITRNTNGQFYLYIKGGTFGFTYTLVSVTGGSWTNPVINNTHTSSNYFVLDLDANDMIANIVCQQGEGSLDLNSYERIYHSDNRNFTKTGGLAWTGAGNHSIDTTSTEKRIGTYSGMITTTGAGDSTTNYISLPAVNFDTLKQDVNSVYEKYTLEFWVKSKGSSGLPRVNIRIGNQLKTSDTISNIAFEKVVFNFQSNALVSNQPILLYVNQADTVFVDDITLTKAYDLSISWWVKTSTNAGAFWAYNQIGSSENDGYSTYINSDKIRYLHSDGTIVETGNFQTTNSTNNINDNTWRMGNTITRRATDSMFVFNNGTISKNLSAIGCQQGSSGLFTVGAFRDATSKLPALFGNIQITKFTDISQSNVNSTTLTTAYNRGKLIQNEWTGGSPVEVAFYDWKGSTTNEMLSDKSSMENNLTGTNITIDDRVKIKSKFK